VRRASNATARRHQGLRRQFSRHPRHRPPLYAAGQLHCGHEGNGLEMSAKFKEAILGALAVNITEC
jgi:hypothetical protein